MIAPRQDPDLKYLPLREQRDLISILRELQKSEEIKQHIKHVSCFILSLSYFNDSTLVHVVHVCTCTCIYSGKLNVLQNEMHVRTYIILINTFHKMFRFYLRSVSIFQMLCSVQAIRQIYIRPFLEFVATCRYIHVYRDVLHVCPNVWQQLAFDHQPKI